MNALRESLERLVDSAERWADGDSCREARETVRADAADLRCALDELERLGELAARLKVRAENAEVVNAQRMPTQAEVDALADNADEAFVVHGGWTARRCRLCRRWVFGGPTACEPCVVRAERDAWRKALQGCDFRELPDDPEKASEMVADYIAGFIRDVVDLRGQNERLRADLDVAESRKSEAFHRLHERATVAERALEKAHAELCTAYKDWDADRDHRVGKRIANACEIIKAALAAPAAETAVDDVRTVLLQLCASLTLADHMGDAMGYVHAALRRVGIVLDGKTAHPVQTALAKLGVTTLYGTSLAEAAPAAETEAPPHPAPGGKE